MIIRLGNFLAFFLCFTGDRTSERMSDPGLATHISNHVVGVDGVVIRR
jgi:hypothetical protein